MKSLLAFTALLATTSSLWAEKPKPRHTIMTGHPRAIFSLAYSPDGKLLASGSGSTNKDWGIRLWDTTTNKELKILKDSEEAIDNLQFSPDSKLLASAGVHLRIWDVAAGKKLFDLKGHGSSVTSLSFHPAGKMLASSDEDRTVRIWDVTTGKELICINDISSSVNYAPDGKTLVYEANPGLIKLWDVATKKERAVLKTEAFQCFPLAISPDSKMIAFYGPSNKKSSDDPIKLWDFTGKELRQPLDHTGDVTALIFHPGGELLASTSRNTVQVWNVKTGKQLISIPILVHSLAFSPDGKTLAVGGRDKTITLWDVPDTHKR